MLGLHEGVRVHLPPPLICRSITCKHSCFTCQGGHKTSGGHHIFLCNEWIELVLCEKRSPSPIMQQHSCPFSWKLFNLNICFTFMHIGSLNTFNRIKNESKDFNTSHKTILFCEFSVCMTSSCPHSLYQIYKEVWGTPFWDTLSLAINQK